MKIRRKAILFPVGKKSADIRNIGSNAGNGAKQEMVGVAALQIESETALGDLTQKELVTHLVFVEERSEFTRGNELEEKFEFGLVGRGNDGIGPLHQLVRRLAPESGKLTCGKFEFAAGVERDLPE